MKNRESEYSHKPFQEKAAFKSSLKQQKSTSRIDWDRYKNLDYETNITQPYHIFK